ncbi:glycosyltransferase family 2 protein [Streptomyces niveus]|uniref:glycosyltransferase family 2 protein n=1 Tax=Streptomyces niveus TaxID=193462 RepID=UPI00368042D9
MEGQLPTDSPIIAALIGESPTHSAPDAEVAVITPTRLRPDRIAYLLELYASLCDQDVSWEWVLALDGVSEEGVPEALRTDVRVKVVPLPRPVGAGAARNFAVNEVTAEWLTTSDDDVLPAQSLSVRLRYVAARPVDQPGGFSWLVAAHGGDRPAAPVAAPHLHHRRVSTPAPGTGTRRGHRESGLVLEDDVGPQRRRGHSACGHTSFFHIPTACSSRSSARRGPETARTSRACAAAATRQQTSSRCRTSRRSAL